MSLLARPRARHIGRAFPRLLAIAGALVMLILGATVDAQVATPPNPSTAASRHAAAVQPQATGTRKWEAEGYGGVSWLQIPMGGSRALPPAGAGLTTSSPIFPARQAASWLFGDGAAMLNDASAQFGVATRLTPLDAILTASGSGGASAGVFGVRMRREVTRRFSAEAGIDVLAGGGGALSDTTRAAIEASRASFESAFTALFATGPLTGAVVHATATTTAGSSREVAITGAMQMRFGARGSFVPFVTFGGGVLTRPGSAPSTTIEGTYAFAINGVIPIRETDRVTIRYAHDPSVIGVVGGGLRRDLSGRWGFRLEGRLLIGANPTRVLIDATPSNTPGTPAGFIETFTYPNIQFSNAAATGRTSTLSGPALQDFAAFSGGIQTRVLLSVGLIRRF